MNKLEQVFVLNGNPIHTFVEPIEFARVRINLRTPGRGLIIEGPSGIGKTTAVERAIQEEGFGGKVTVLSARRREDIEYIKEIDVIVKEGITVIDDFHKLDGLSQERIADHMKLLADEGDENLKLIVVGINDSGARLIKIADDLTNRIDIVPFENNPDEKLIQLIELGERALNIEILSKDDICKECYGSFYLAQMLCFESCMKAGIIESSELVVRADVSVEAVKSSVWRRLDSRFLDRVKTFCEGVRRRTEGRAPYLHLLKWLAESDNWVLSIKETLRNQPNMRLSVGQVLEKGYLEQLFQDNPVLQEQIHYEKTSSKLIVEDPQFVFYIKNMPWARFSNDLGFKNVFEGKYDFALSFAGSVREIAERLFEMLSEEEFQVFYDKNEQHRIVSNDIEDYLHPIYNSEAKYIVCILDDQYPSRVWTRFEEKAMQGRLGESIIPIIVGDAKPSAFSRIKEIGYLSCSENPLVGALNDICDTIVKKYNEDHNY